MCFLLKADHPLQVVDGEGRTFTSLSILLSCCWWHMANESFVCPSNREGHVSLSQQTQVSYGQHTRSNPRKLSGAIAGRFALHILVMYSELSMYCTRQAGCTTSDPPTLNELAIDEHFFNWQFGIQLQNSGHRNYETQVSGKLLMLGIPHA